MSSKAVFNILGQDYRFLKILFTILASYLIFEEFYTFLVVKPTYNTNTKRKMGTEDFPDMILCPDPPIDMAATNSKGYEGVQEYFMGIGPDFFKVLEHMGWIGNKSEDINKVSEDISILKSSWDCPMGNESYFWYQDSKSLTFELIELELAKALYPNHICCKVVLPEFSPMYPVFGLQIGFSGKGSFKLFMADQLTASYFDQHKPIMLGDKIVSNAGKGYMNYKVQIMEEVKLENDPAYHCIDYRVEGEYARCIENEIIRQNSYFLNCTPPWMTDNIDLWCKGKYTIDSYLTGLKYLNFLGEISVSEADPGTCSVPCRVKRYDVKEIGMKQSKYGYKGMVIWFEKQVEITKSALQIGPKTLISKIGGFIGISKNFLWIIIMMITTSTALVSHFKVKK